MQLNFPIFRKCLPLLVVLWMVPAWNSLAKAQIASGQEAQAVQDAPGQGEPKERKPKPNAAKDIDEAQNPSLKPHHAVELSPSQHLDQRIAKHFSPQKPNRPIPVVLIVLGMLMVLLWGGLLTGVILTTGVVAIVLLIAMIVFLPVLVFGIIFLIGGIAASSSKSRKAEPENGQGS